MDTCLEPRARQITNLDVEARRLRLDVTTWAMATGAPIDFDALTVILAAKAEDLAPLRLWRDEDVWRLWWIDLSTWCARRGLRPPAQLAATMRTLFDHLEAVDGFDAASDERSLLAAALGAAGATDRRHPAAGTAGSDRPRGPKSTRGLHLA